MMKWNLFIDLLHCDIILMTIKHIFPLISSLPQCNKNAIFIALIKVKITYYFKYLK